MKFTFVRFDTQLKIFLFLFTFAVIRELSFTLSSVIHQCFFIIWGKENKQNGYKNMSHATCLILEVVACVFRRKQSRQVIAHRQASFALKIPWFLSKVSCRITSFGKAGSVNVSSFVRTPASHEFTSWIHVLRDGDWFSDI